MNSIHYGSCGIANCGAEDVPTSFDIGDVTCEACWNIYRAELRQKHDHKPAEGL